MLKHILAKRNSNLRLQYKEIPTILYHAEGYLINQSRLTPQSSHKAISLCFKPITYIANVVIFAVLKDVRLC